MNYLRKTRSIRILIALLTSLCAAHTYCAPKKHVSITQIRARDTTAFAATTPAPLSATEEVHSKLIELYTQNHTLPTLEEHKKLFEQGESFQSQDPYTPLREAFYDMLDQEADKKIQKMSAQQIKTLYADLAKKDTWLPGSPNQEEMRAYVSKHIVGQMELDILRQVKSQYTLKSKIPEVVKAWNEF
jgi:hypothetical protein